MAPGADGGAVAFDMLCVERVVFGPGRVEELPALAAGLGRRVLLVTNAGDVGAGTTTDRVAGLLEAGKLEVTCCRHRGEPTVASVAEALATARAADCDAVVALGGGSAIDAGKAVAALLTNPGEPLDYMEVVGRGHNITRPAAPWLAVPTTAGTGAEVTRNAVVASTDHGVKASIRGAELLARAVLVDPELHVRVRPAVTASAGMDAFCQLVEAYTSRNAQPVTDAVAHAGLVRVAGSLRRAYADGEDLPARADMALAAMLSGFALTNAGLGAAHGFAGPLGGMLQAPHGMVCAALLPHVMAANLRAARAGGDGGRLIVRYADVGRALGCDAADDDGAADAAVEAVGELACDLLIPPLREFGLTGEHVEAVVAQARKSSSMRYNPVALDEQALAAILHAAM